jgi:transcriptional regulator with XRE-family HTH domain
MDSQGFGSKIRDERERKGKTLREAAAELGINHAYLSQLETGLAKPSEDLARKLAGYYGMNEEEIAFLARGIPQVIADIKKRFPTVSPGYFRKASRPEKKK